MYGMPRMMGSGMIGPGMMGPGMMMGGDFPPYQARRFSHTPSNTAKILLRHVFNLLSSPYMRTPLPDRPAIMRDLHCRVWTGLAWMGQRGSGSAWMMVQQALHGRTPCFTRPACATSEPLSS